MILFSDTNQQNNFCLNFINFWLNYMTIFVVPLIFSAEINLIQQKWNCIQWTWLNLKNAWMDIEFKHGLNGGKWNQTGPQWMQLKANTVKSAFINLDCTWMKANMASLGFIGYVHLCERKEMKANISWFITTPKELKDNVMWLVMTESKHGMTGWNWMQKGSFWK
jgi:hypothetical protein